jgi:hypothetical protein
MSDLTFSAALVAKSFDANNNNQVQDDVKFSAAALAKVDTDKNGQVSVAELTTAIETDKVVISNGQANVPKGKVTIANILGASDALDNANSAVVQTQEQLKPLQKWDSGRKNIIANAQLRNTELDYSNALFTKAIQMSTDRWTGETIKDDTYYRAVNGRKANNQRIAANNAMVQQISGLSPAPLQATLQTKAREIYDIGVKMTTLTKTSSKSEVAQLKAQLTAITSTVAAAGTTATDYVNTLNNSHIQ